MSDLSLLTDIPPLDRGAEPELLVTASLAPSLSAVPSACRGLCEKAPKESHSLPVISHLSKPRNTIRMSDEDKMRYIAHLNSTTKPSTASKRLSETPPERYHRHTDSGSKGLPSNSLYKVAKSVWNARDSEELTILEGDKLMFHLEDSSWVLGERISEPGKRGWFPITVLLSTAQHTSTRLEIRSIKGTSDLPTSESLQGHRKRISLRLETFLANRPNETELVEGHILQTDYESSRESYALIPAPPPLPHASLVGTAIGMFNKHARKGVEFVIKNQVLEDCSARGIAQWLFQTSDIDKHVLGDYLGDPESMNCQVRDCIFDFLDFSCLEYDMALRRFLDVFRLPGEAQKIDRLMEAFAKKYYAGHREGFFRSADAAYILAFSTVMLNTDLHNPSVKKKMTKDQWVSQNRGVNESADFPREFLEDLYDTIEEDEITDRTLLPGAFKRGWLGVWCHDPLPRKQQRSWVMLDKNGLYCFSHPENFRATATIPLRIIESLTKTSKEGEFIILTTNRYWYTLTARSTRSQESWLAAITNLRGDQQTEGDQKM